MIRPSAEQESAMSELIAESLEYLADTDLDVYQRVFDAFYRESPAAENLMLHMDELTKGRMLEEVTRLLMSVDVELEAAYLDFELRNHEQAYGVERQMYRQLFNAFAAVVRDLAGDRWTPEYEQVWHSRIDELSSAMEAA